MSAREIPYADFEAIEKTGSLEKGPLGEGEHKGHRFWIQRYYARQTGLIYDVAFTPGVDTVPHVAEITPEATPTR